MKMLHTKERYQRRGFTMIEVLIVVSITVIIGGVTVLLLYGHRNVSEINSTALKIATSLREARSFASAQKDDANWGVYFDNTDKASPFFATFSGDTHEAGVETLRTPLPKTVQFLDPEGNPDPDQGSKEVTFSKLYGDPSQPGFKVSLQLAGSQNDSSTIAVLPTGAIAYDLLTCSITSGCVKTTAIIGGDDLGGQGCPPGQPCGLKRN